MVNTPLGHHLSILVLLLTVLISGTALATTISGTAYDLSLETLNNTVFELRESGSAQTQRYISKDATYTFDVSEGAYTLIATSHDMVSVDTIIVEGEHDIIHDIILLESISDLESLLEESQSDLIGSEASTIIDTAPTLYWLYGGLIGIVLLAIVIARYMLGRRSTQKLPTTLEENNLKQQVLEFISSQEGRTTQKEIRQQFSYSEAKISLVLSELESNGTIKKIKRGRRNIIIKNE